MANNNALVEVEYLVWSSLCMLRCYVLSNLIVAQVSQDEV